LVFSTFSADAALVEAVFFSAMAVIKFVFCRPGKLIETTEVINTI
jgi:hypothetical protein